MNRRRWLLWSAPVVLAVLAVAVKLASLSLFAGRGEDAYRAGRYADAQVQYAHLGFVDVLESWVSPFDRGDALYGAKRYPAARFEFARALPLAPHDQVCTVRHNLTLAGERIGDTAVVDKDRAGAIRAYTRALRDAGTCTSTKDQRDRLRTLLEQIHTPRQGTPKPRSGRTTSPPDQQQRLQQRNRDATRRQQQMGDGTDNANNGHDRSNPNGKNW